MITDVIHSVLSGDPTLAALLTDYRGDPAVFTTDPVPGDAVLPYVVTAGNMSDAPFDTKTSRGNTIFRDVRCYTAAGGGAVQVEAIADRVRVLLHRQALVIPGYQWIWSECSGPIAADEQDAYARIVTVKMTIVKI